MKKKILEPIVIGIGIECFVFIYLGIYTYLSNREYKLNKMPILFLIFCLNRRTRSAFPMRNLGTLRLGMSSEF